jgi:hypothetical protein
VPLSLPKIAAPQPIGKLLHPFGHWLQISIYIAKRGKVERKRIQMAILFNSNILLFYLIH